MFYDLYASIAEPGADVDLVDSIVSSTLSGMLNTFMKKELVGISDNESHYFQVVAALMDGFTLYKTENTNRAVEFLESCMVHSQWILAAILWLKRRPSFKA